MKSVHFQSNTPEWSTQQNLYDELNKKYKFTLDPCCTKENAKCKKFYTKKENGLVQSWKGERVFMNPPYGRVIGQWIKKAVESEAKFVVCLLPARTDTKWFHDYLYKKHEIHFIKGRLKFGGCKNSAPFPSMIVIIKK
jgi:site-specific DNA-methyltransferase (adenine-specific)